MFYKIKMLEDGFSSEEKYEKGKVYILPEFIAVHFLITGMAEELKEEEKENEDKTEDSSFGGTSESRRGKRLPKN